MSNINKIRQITHLIMHEFGVPASTIKRIYNIKGATGVNDFLSVIKSQRLKNKVAEGIEMYLGAYYPWLAEGVRG